MATALGAPGDAEEIAARAGLEAPQARVPIDWMLRFLAARGWVDGGPGRGESLGIGCAASCPRSTPSPVRQEQQRWDPSWMPAYALAETVARDYPAFLRGEVTGEDVLFAPRRLRLWVDYFSNDNGLYAVNNRVGAVAVAEWLPGPGELDSRARRRARQRRAGAARGARGAGPSRRHHAATASPSPCRRSSAEASRRCGIAFPALAGLSVGALDMNRGSPSRAWRPRACPSSTR